MRCKACDGPMSDKDARTKFLYSGDYSDLCGECLSQIRDMAPTQDDDVRQAPPDDDDSQPKGEQHDEIGSG